MKRPARAASGSMKRPAPKDDAESTVSYEELQEACEEEVPRENDSVVSPKGKRRANPSSLKVLKKPAASRSLSKKPATLPVATSGPNDVSGMEHLKSDDEKAQGLLSEKHYEDGWRELWYRTPKGRSYVKIVRPDGKAFYSKKSATEAGFRG